MESAGGLTKVLECLGYMGLRGASGEMLLGRGGELEQYCDGEVLQMAGEEILLKIVEGRLELGDLGNDRLSTEALVGLVG
jgi:hypothetical protein